MSRTVPETEVDTDSCPVPVTGDGRVRLSLPPGAKNLFYNRATTSEQDLLKPLKRANGIIFPFVPQIVINNTAAYSQLSPAHTNYPYQVYNNSYIGTINIFGQFTAQTEAEAKYVLAVITFMRVVTKSFRNSDPLAGNPPVILRLTGHGQNMLPSVPVVATSFDLTLPREVDYIKVSSIPEGSVGIRNAFATDNIPSMTDISITLNPVYSRKQASTFSMKNITNGQGLIGDKGGFI